MNITKTLKNIATKEKCKIGFHEGNIYNIYGKPECYFERICSECGKLEIIEKHKFPKEESIEYDKKEKCNKTLVCEYCNTAKITVEDHKSFVKAGTNGKCQVLDKCTRCGKLKTRNTTEHNWVRQPNYHESKSVTYKCSLCGTEQSRSY